MQLPLWQRVLIWLVCAGAAVIAVPNLFYGQVERSNDAEEVIATGVTDDALVAQAAEWPGFLPDDLLNDYLPLIRKAVARAAARRAAPFQDDIAQAVLFLCSDLAAGATGDVTYVDAGYHVLGMTGIEGA